MFNTTFLKHLQELQHSICPDKNYALMVTNITAENMDTEHYCAIFDPTYLLFALRNPFKKNVLRYDFVTQKLTRNGKEEPNEKMNDFITKLTQAVFDVQKNKARSYKKIADHYKNKSAATEPVQALVR